MTHWQGQLDFGVVHALAFPECRGGEGPVVETLEQIVADEFFGAVEIAPVRDPEVRERARQLLSWSQMQVVYLPILPMLFQGINAGSADDAERSAARERLHALIDEAISFNSVMAMVGTPPDPGPELRPALVERLAEDFRELCDYADARSSKRRLFITLEPFDRDVEKKRAIGPTREAAALADAIDRENFGLTVDLSHLPMLKESAGEAISAAGRHLIHAHIGNTVVDDPTCPFFGDFHPRFGHPQGRNDLPDVIEYINTLTAANFWQQAKTRTGSTPILSMELKPNQVDNESSSAILANGKRTFARAWSQSKH